MGIRYLNRYLQSNCNEGIKQINLHELSGKKIAIDTSIYLYRYMGENALLENFYLMISIFREYNISPLFVFDGKPPQQKEDLLKLRKEEKKEAEQKYKKLQETIKNADEDEKKEILENLDTLKKMFIKIHHSDIDNIKSLIKSYGVSYIDAPGEADKLCAKLVNKNKVYACLSEDMDLFVYGCNRVLRYLSLLKKSAVLYDYKKMLSELNLTCDEFKSICIISGTDYNIDTDNNLIKTLKLFKKYKKDTETKLSFYEWLEEHTNYISDICELYQIHLLFSLTDMDEYKKYEKTKIINGPINMECLQNIMSKEDFLFC